MLHVCVIVAVWLAVFLGAFLGYFGLLGVAVALSLSVAYLIIVARRKQGIPEEKRW